MKNINIKYFILVGGLCISTFGISCKKFTDIEDPYTLLSPKFVFATDVSAEAALNGLFGKLATGTTFNGGTSSVTHFGALSSDELECTSQNVGYIELGTNAILPNNENVSGRWTELYNLIYGANSILEGAGESSTISAAKRRQCEGEAKFVRAFCYFYLVNFFGNVPLVTTTDYRINNILSRTSSDEVYRLVERDLLDAKANLGNDYVSGPKRLRPNKATVSAFLARVYLYQKKYVEAERETSEVIAQNGLYGLEPILTDVFLTGSKEAIWQFALTDQSTNAIDHAVMFMTDENNVQWSMSPALLNSFEATDKRKQLWTGELVINGVSYINPRKYRSVTANNDREAYIVFRLAEQYLIRAEARAFQGNLDPVMGALADLNKIRDRAGLGALSGLSQAQVITAIDAENRHEFFCEWGGRWLDLKRRGMVNAVMSAHRPATWQNTDALYPIPKLQIDANPNTVQNPGYFQ